jgi:hypothetical protein
MAQADSVPSSSRQLITGESTKQSTNLPAVAIKSFDRNYIIGRSHAPVIPGSHQAPPPRLRHQRRDVEPESLLSFQRYDANTSQEPAGSNIGALSYESIGFLLGRLLRSILLILLRFRSRNKRLPSITMVSSNQLVRSKPQGRLQ